MKVVLRLQLLGVLVFVGIFHSEAWARYSFVVEETPYTRLCGTKNILTVNGTFPGPTLYVRRGDTVVVDVYNKGTRNITIHWHGVKQSRNPWSDGPEYITQCPIQPGAKFSQNIIFSTEEGTLWWHAHSEWDRATVHGAIIIYPKNGTDHYPFPKPHAEFPIILGEWWKQDIDKVYNDAIQSGGDPVASDALTINGQPGDFYPCSSKSADTFKLKVDFGKTYLLRLVNNALQISLYFAIANHTLAVVGSDASYLKPFVTDYISISPGQTIDVLFTANQNPNHLYYMAAGVSSDATPLVVENNTTTTAIIHYNNQNHTSRSTTPLIPKLPSYDDTISSVNFTSRFRSLVDKNHPIDVPKHIRKRMFFTVSMNTLPCPNDTSCQGPNGSRLATSVNNISFVTPTPIDLLEAYYYQIKGAFGVKFPSFPPLKFNFTAEDQPSYLETPKRGIELKVLKYNASVQIVFQGTSIVDPSEHPMHLHGFSFYVVGIGSGNFDKHKDRLKFNLVDPPLQNTIAVPLNGWIAIRFKADNPGVWFMHCHFDRHMSWGMDMAFIVKNGKTPNTQMLPPPPDMPPC
ncbi:hypothetical protein L484_019695 [Morus notabilis]|uniref:Laccase n=1 Tax=Morus notabilis TaxID=981085 RepID=W9QDI3_9ROSA|nr:hypothetical protein L484_019695 [Morus notabilis]